MSHRFDREQFIPAVLAGVADLEWQIVESDLLDTLQAPGRPAPRASGKTYLLVVKNDHGVATSVRSLAAQHGHVCIVAQCANEAWQLCQGLRFDCVFIDMQLVGEGALDPTNQPKA